MRTTVESHWPTVSCPRTTWGAPSSSSESARRICAGGSGAASCGCAGWSRSSCGTNSASTIAFSSDGERLACAGGDGVVKVRNSRTGKVLKTIPAAHKGYASSVAFHSDGEHLITVGADRLAKVWDLTTDRPRNVFERPCDAAHMFGTAYAAAFSPLDPNHFAVGYE